MNGAALNNEQIPCLKRNRNTMDMLKRFLNVLVYLKIVLGKWSDFFSPQLLFRRAAPRCQSFLMYFQKMCNTWAWCPQKSMWVSVLLLDQALRPFLKERGPIMEHKSSPEQWAVQESVNVLSALSCCAALWIPGVCRGYPGLAAEAQAAKQHPQPHAIFPEVMKVVF